MHLSAQNVVTGTVTDRKGNPVPGAKVEVKDGTESTITNLDGTFTLETEEPVKKVKVYYVGLQPKEQKVKPDMLIRMSSTNWWRERPDKYRWFLSVQAAFPDCEDITPSFGLMVGGVKHIGWYVKGVYSKVPKTQGTIISSGGSNDYWYTGKIKQSYWNVTAGVIARLWCPIYVYAGAGYSDRKVAWETHTGTYMEYEPNSYYDLVIDFGLMLKIKKIFVNAGMMLNNYDLSDAAGCFGIGYCF